jgi:opacity protein-like surface antigen
MYKVALLSGLVMACASVAQAQLATSNRPVQIVVSGGLQLPMGEFADVHDYGIHADFSVLVKTLGSLRLRPELTYARFGIKDAFSNALPNVLAGAGGGGRARDYGSDAVSSLLGGLANIEIALGSGGFQPFVLAGLGAMNFKTDVGTVSEALSETNLTLNVGAGVRFRLGGIGGLIEARLNNMPTKQSETYFKSLRTVPVTFGLIF